MINKSITAGCLLLALPLSALAADDIPDDLKPALLNSIIYPDKKTQDGVKGDKLAGKIRLSITDRASTRMDAPVTKDSRGRITGIDWSRVNYCPDGQDVKDIILLKTHDNPNLPIKYLRTYTESMYEATGSTRCDIVSFNTDRYNLGEERSLNGYTVLLEIKKKELKSLTAKLAGYRETLRDGIRNDIIQDRFVAGFKGNQACGLDMNNWVLTNLLNSPDYRTIVSTLGINEVGSPEEGLYNTDRPSCALLFGTPRTLFSVLRSDSTKYRYDINPGLFIKASDHDKVFKDYETAVAKARAEEEAQRQRELAAQKKAEEEKARLAAIEEQKRREAYDARQRQLAEQRRAAEIAEEKRKAEKAAYDACTADPACKAQREEKARLAREMAQRKLLATVQGLKVKGLSLGGPNNKCTPKETVYEDVMKNPVMILMECETGTQEDRLSVTVNQDTGAVLKVTRKQVVIPSSGLQTIDILKGALNFYGQPTFGDLDDWILIYGTAHEATPRNAFSKVKKIDNGAGLAVYGQRCAANTRDVRQGFYDCRSKGIYVITYELINRPGMTAARERGKQIQAARIKKKAAQQDF